MKISHTIYPDQPLTQNEWMEQFRVASQVTKYGEGLNRAREMMRDWNVVRSEEQPVWLRLLTFAFFS
jgi:hypothetical protein